MAAGTTGNGAEERRLILCIDDDETLPEVLASTLEPAGFEVKDILPHPTPNKDFRNIALKIKEIDPDLVIPDPMLSIRDGAVATWGESVAKDSGWTANIVKALSRAYKIDLDMPWKKIPAKRTIARRPNNPRASFSTAHG